MTITDKIVEAKTIGTTGAMTMVHGATKDSVAMKIVTMLQIPWKKNRIFANHARPPSIHAPSGMSTR